MNVLPKYVIVDTMRITLVALLVFTAIFFVASSISATREGVTLSQFLRITPFLAIYIIRYTLPISLLVGVTFTLGRMVADREVLALRACGVHFGSIALPLLLLGIYFSAGLYIFNDRIMPVCDYMRRSVLKSFAREILTLQKGRNKSFKLPGYSVFCKEYDGRTLKGLMVFRDDSELPFEIIAREGKVWLSRDERHVIIALEDVRITHYGTHTGEADKQKTDNAKVATSSDAGKVSYGELVSQNYSIFVPVRQRTKERPSFFTLAELKRETERVEKAAKLMRDAFENARTKEARQRLASDVYKVTNLERKMHIEYHRRGATAVAPFLFLLVGIPFPLLLNSRVKLVPAFAALMTVMFAHYAVGLGAESFAEKGSLEPWFAMWLGNILIICIGIFLFWKLFEK